MKREVIIACVVDKVPLPEAEIIVVLKMLTSCHTRDVGGVVWDLRGDRCLEIESQRANNSGTTNEKVPMFPTNT